MTGQSDTVVIINMSLYLHVRLVPGAWCLVVVSLGEQSGGHIL